MAVRLSRAAAALAAAGAADRAVPLDMRPMTLLHRTLGPRSLHLARTMASTAALLAAQTEPGTVEKLVDRGEAILTERLGEDHPDTARVRELRGDR